MQKLSEKYLKGTMVLMAVVVLLPSVALLWFVSKTIENERYALREKLAEKYSSLCQEKQEEAVPLLQQLYRQEKERTGHESEMAIDWEKIDKTIERHFSAIRRLKKEKHYEEAIRQLTKQIDDPNTDPIVKLVAQYFLLEIKAQTLTDSTSLEPLMRQFSDSVLALDSKNREFGEVLYEKAVPLYVAQEIRAKVADNLVSVRLVNEEEQKTDEEKFDLEKSGLVLFRLAAPMDRYLLYVQLRDGGFAASAKKQRILYLWLASTVICITLLALFVLVTMVARWNRLHRLRNDFLATVSHELKTPLTSIRLLVDTLKDNVVDDEKSRSEYLEIIASQNERLSRLIDSFLSYSRMERNKKQLHFEEVDPKEIASDAAQVIQVVLKEEHKLQTELGDNLPPIFADREMFTIAIVNLLDNAVKYTGQQKSITLQLYQENHNICFTVEDNGCGMTERQRKKIFQKFYRADNRLSRQTEGVGLGLAIVRFIVEAHRGKVDVTSEVEKGSRFTIKIPAIDS